MALFLPVISEEVMQQLREDETPTEKIFESFEKNQPNVVAGLRKAFGEGDDLDLAVSYLSLMLRGIELELTRRLA